MGWLDGLLVSRPALHLERNPMPQTTSGEGYRTFKSDIYEASSEDEVKQIELPTDKSMCFVGTDDESTALAVWKFYVDSVAAASATVLIPDNPLFADAGRWINVPAGGSGPGDDVWTTP